MQDDVFLILGIAIIFLLALLAICVVFLVWRYRQLPNPGLFPGAPQVEHKPVQGLPPQTTPAPELGRHVHQKRLQANGKPTSVHLPLMIVRQLSFVLMPKTRLKAG
ncbi:MAG: hypothetical protein HY023_07860 [Chloroflexi bacterium]|nr:hypothetical protein [Chloroflexota bacterium]